ncbi:MAG: heme ABC exporter ATP-binding protein CcmA [Geminicoccaceae bacterium]|nr:MAG: heme ABC exporter ATP-binding protein CcmA [Geminicoccaceae bacterium]
MPVLARAADLHCRRAGRDVFQGVAFRVDAGRALVLRGPNGSGKSSLLRLLAGLLEPAGGSFEVATAPDGAPDFHYIGHGDPAKPALTVEENLAFAAALTGGNAVEAGLRAFALQRLADTPARYLSSGQRRRLTLARLIAVDKRLWLLDEPGVGLDAANRSRLETVIVTHLEQGGAVIAATHGDIAIEGAAVLEFGR